MKHTATRLELRELTSPQPGAVSVLELRGPGALRRILELAPGASLEPGALRLLRLQDQDELVDEALVWAPTEDRVELHLHGSRPLVQRVVRALAIAPATLEAVHRTLEERAWEASASAPTEAGARVLLDQAEGALRKELVALVQADPAEFLARLQRLVSRSRGLESLFRPPRVVLAGPANAGKSTLFNALVGFERVVVDATHGTTRDAVQERISIGAYPVDLVDTAGMREDSASTHGPGAIEREGQASGRALWADAQLLLWLQPVETDDGDPLECAPARCVRIYTRGDEQMGERAAELGASISALHEPERARRIVTEVISTALGFEARPWSPGAPVLFDSPEWRWALEALESGDRSAMDNRRAELDSLLAR